MIGFIKRGEHHEVNQGAAMEPQLTLTLFTPAMAEKIAGLSVATQRDYRRRGFIKQNEGHARFDAFDLAEMMVLNDMSKRGIGPKDTSSVSKICALAIVYHALQWIDSYEGDHEKVHEWNAHVFPDGVSWGMKAEWLARAVLRERGLSAVPAPLFIWWADGTHTFQVSFDKAFNDGLSDDARWNGPVVILSLQALAGRLIDGAGSALVHVEFQADPS